jgi:uncharacterized repeat protein (TIGR03803 family)
MSAKFVCRFVAKIIRGCLVFGVFGGLLAGAQTYKVIYEAPGTDAGVANPDSRAVTQGRNGNMYFTSVAGGSLGDGTLFEVTPAGKAGIVASVGYFVVSGATLGSDGNFYGTNQDGGPGGGCGFSGCGQVYKVTPAGAETILYNFTGEGDGSSPQSAPIQAANGIFYGTTSSDGGTDESTAYEITSSGTFKTLHTFAQSEGYNIEQGLIQASDGNFYGTAYYGGANGLGTIFRMTPSGVVTVLHNFVGNAGNDGANPCCALLQASDGNLYGTTTGAGGEGIYGVVFKIALDGAYTILHYINPNNGDGAEPTSTLTQGSDGKLYGVTGAPSGGFSGTLFNMTTSGTFTTLYTFCQGDGSCTDGYSPSSPLQQNTNGVFYGSTISGGNSGCDVGCGVVYSLNVGLKPFVSPLQNSGREGALVEIRGEGLTGSSVVKFGGVQAKVVGVEATFIGATVPAGALTGPITVTTGSTTLTSPTIFRVTPGAITFNPESGPVGTSVTITGTGLDQTTKVTFDGKSASFSVSSDTEVTATVPAGAATGKIVVTTKGGGVTSSTSFTVN